jgi:hypothetical protein
MSVITISVVIPTTAGGEGHDHPAYDAKGFA